MEHVSIIIPVYNSEKYLRDCLESVVNQTYRDLEIILVDDASTDSSRAICDEFADKDGRIKVIHHSENKGLSLSKYNGYKLATGEWISFIDNDDLISKYMYTELTDLARKNDEADVICVAGEDVSSRDIRARIIQINDDKIIKDNQSARNIVCVSGSKACQMLYGRNVESITIHGIYSATWGKIIKRSLFEKALIETIRYKDRLYWIFLEDVLFIPICTHMANKVVLSDNVSYLHRISENNLSARLNPSEYHYETIVANDIVQDYFRTNSMEQVADNMLKGLLLNMQSVWYKVYRYETDNYKRSNGLSIIDALWIKYLKLYKVANNKNDFLSNVSINLFDLNKNIWLRTIGDLHFKHGI